MRKYSPLKRKGGIARCYDRQKAEIRCARSKDLSSRKSASGCTEKDEENAALRDTYEAVPVVHCTALQLLRGNMELLQQGRNH